jgi:hypothetical protein
MNSHSIEYKLCDVTQCSRSSVEADWQFEGKFRLHIQGRRVSQARGINNNQVSNRDVVATCLDYCSTLKTEVIHSSECECTSAELHGVTTEIIELFNMKMFFYFVF